MRYPPLICWKQRPDKTIQGDALLHLLTGHYLSGLWMLSSSSRLRARCRSPVWLSSCSRPALLSLPLVVFVSLPSSPAAPLGIWPQSSSPRRCCPVAPLSLLPLASALVSLLPCSPLFQGINHPPNRASITPLNGTDLLCKWTRTESCLSILGFYLIPPTVCRSAGRCTNSQTQMLFLLHVVLLCTDCHKVAIFGCFITTQVLICLHVITPLWVLIMRICITYRY